MKKLLTRAEVEAIGQNWSDRRDKLLEYAQRKDTEMDKSFKAWSLAWIIHKRIDRIRLALAQTKPKKKFPSGGVFSNTPPGEPDYVIRK